MVDPTTESDEQENPLVTHVLRLSGEMEVLQLFVGVFAASGTSDAQKEAMSTLLDNYKKVTSKTKPPEVAEAMARTADNLKVFLSVGRN